MQASSLHRGSHRLTARPPSFPLRTPMPPKKTDKLSLPALLLLLGLAFGLGSYYRFIVPDQRPMHADEAILAVKFSGLWQGQGFQYDPSDYHGPGLHYVSWLYGKLAGWGAPAEWTEAALRHVPALCGLLVLASALLLLPALSARAALIAMVLTAVSPMMVFYSRYYIMEMLLALLVAVSLAAWWRWQVTRNQFWLVLCGASLGFQHATKETFVLNLGAAAAAWLAASWLISDRERGGGLRLSSPGRRRQSLWKPWQVLLVSAALVSVTCYSALYRDWSAVKDSVLTYASYLQRAEGVGHEKPWHYYLSLIFWRRDGLVWTEALIGGLGIIGMLHAFLGDHRDGKKQRFLVFLSLYTLVLFAGYSAISYKTPWSILSAQHALTLLAGVGAAALWSVFSRGIASLIYQVVIGLGIYHLCDESMLAIRAYKADPRNPYVYAHTSTNLLSLVETVRALHALQPEPPPSIQVINRDQGWPLPWYFRNLPRVGYQAEPPPVLDADIIIAEAAQQTAVQARLRRESYQDTGLYGLRPGVPLIMLVRKSLWEQHMAARRGEAKEEVRKPSPPDPAPAPEAEAESDPAGEFIGPPFPPIQGPPPPVTAP